MSIPVYTYDMLKGLLLSSLLLLFITSKGQFIPRRQPNSVSRLSVLSPKLQAENKITNHQTVVLSIWTGFSLMSTHFTRDTPLSFSPSPGISLEPRQYLNLAAKDEKGKYSLPFAGLYFSMPVTYFFRDRNLSLGGLLGVQGNLGQKGYFNIGLGLGADYYNRHVTTGIIGDVGVGLVLKTKFKKLPYKRDVPLEYMNRPKGR